jgi:flagellar motor switch protein FliN/FliY
MDGDMQYDQLEQADQPQGGGAVDLTHVSEIPMELSAEIGRTHMTVGEALSLRVGSVVALEHLAGEPADLLVNGTPIARGEVVVVDEKFGLRITEILDSHDAYEASPANGGAPRGEQSAPGAPIDASAPPNAGAQAGAPMAAMPESADEGAAPSESLAA